MMQVIQQTKEEKIKMYLKCSKKELAEMLYNANLYLESRPLTFSGNVYEAIKLPNACAANQITYTYSFNNLTGGNY